MSSFTMFFWISEQIRKMILLNVSIEFLDLSYGNPALHVYFQSFLVSFPIFRQNKLRKYCQICISLFSISIKDNHFVKQHSHECWDPHSKPNSPLVERGSSPKKGSRSLFRDCTGKCQSLGCTSHRGRHNTSHLGKDNTPRKTRSQSPFLDHNCFWN